MRSAWVWALIGLGLAPGAPAGLWLLFGLAGVDASVGAARLALIYSGIATAIVFASFGFWTGRLMDRLRRAALHDGLTGLFNRRFLRESLPQLQAVAARRHSPLCVVMIDLDHFKRVNEQLGHPGPQTVSLGVAVQSPTRELTPEQLLDHADLALYRAKHRGRNRVVAWLDGHELTG